MAQNRLVFLTTQYASGHLNTAPKWIWCTSKFASLWAKEKSDGEGIGGGGAQRTIKIDETIILAGNCLLFGVICLAPCLSLSQKTEN